MGSETRGDGGRLWRSQLVALYPRDAIVGGIKDVDIVITVAFPGDIQPPFTDAMAGEQGLVSGSVVFAEKPVIVLFEKLMSARAILILLLPLPIHAIKKLVNMVA